MLRVSAAQSPNPLPSNGNCYRRFVEGFSKRACPLTELLKKGNKWSWTPRCQEAFDNLKNAIMEGSVLGIVDVTKPFEVETDASNFSLGGVLLQEGHPIAYESRKLNEAERRYVASEKEMLAVVHCLRAWRHCLRAWRQYLLRVKFVVKTDNSSICHFFDQPKLSSKQAHWQDCVAKFNFQFEHKPNKANQVANALSWKSEHAALCMLAHLQASKLSGTIRESIKEHLAKDPATQAIMQLAREGKTRQFWVEDNLLFTKENCLYVPHSENLGRLLLKECYDTPWACHNGRQRTYALLKRGYY